MIRDYCKALGLREQDVLGDSRVWKLSEARQMYWLLLRENGFGVSEIGRLNGRSHATVLQGIRHIEGLIAADVEVGRRWGLVKHLKR